MNSVVRLRGLAGLTQVDMARRAGTSQPTIAAYEAGSKSPTARTLERIAAALGFSVVYEFVPEMTREERRSLALHRAIADRLIERPRGCDRSGPTQPDTHAGTEPPGCRIAGRVVDAA